MRRRQRRSDCPVHFALEVFGDAWTLLIIRDLMFKGRASYTDFLRAEEGIATNVLADRLVRLEEDGVLEKTAGTSRKSAGVYRLTSKGIDLLPIMLEIIGWSAKYDPKTAADRRFVRRLRRDRTRLEAEIRAALVGRTRSAAASSDRRHVPGSSARKTRPKEVSR
jgi:DNA-binding HxlR family transcriptional regulator